MSAEVMNQVLARHNEGRKEMKLSFCTDSVWVVAICASVALAPAIAIAQAADWRQEVWHEPQVRYILADMNLGGNVDLYRSYAQPPEPDPDSREAIRLWDAGVRVVNLTDFERKWIKNEFGKDAKVMRIVFRGSERTITGNELLLTSDRGFHQQAIRTALTALTLGAPESAFEGSGDANAAEALRRWRGGARATNADWFELAGKNGPPMVVYRGTRSPVDGTKVRLNSDNAYCEANARYFLADIFLGGGRAFYVRAAESAHEMACREAVARYDAGITITNLRDLERKQINGQTVITRKGSRERIRGTDVKLSTDAAPAQRAPAALKAAAAMAKMPCLYVKPSYSGIET
jgi:hypothetical protein